MDPRIDNWINGSLHTPVSSQYIPVNSPLDNSTIAYVAISNRQDVNEAVEHAKSAWLLWRQMTTKMRTSIIFDMLSLFKQHQDELAELIMAEHGKTRPEALAEIAKGIESFEFACGLPQLISGKLQEVSRNIHCSDRRDPMVPLALASGNCIILKPSEKVPLSVKRLVELMHETTLPAGVLQLVNGQRETVEALCDHPDVKIVTFVGTSVVAKQISLRCHQLDKRVLALGSAKNHLVSYPDSHLEITASDVVSSFTGCTGQRCMATSVLLTIGEQQELIDLIVAKASLFSPGQEALDQLGPVIDQDSINRIVDGIQQAQDGGATILLDGRKWIASPIIPDKWERGHWIGPTVILHHNKEDRLLHQELFGPVLSIYKAKSKEEAIDIQNSCQYGNAASIYTKDGGIAEWFSKRFTSGMIGINISIPVPREPFSFGGTMASKFGDFDITGDDAISFFTIRRKTTTKWHMPEKQELAPQDE